MDSTDAAAEPLAKVKRTYGRKKDASSGSTVPALSFTAATAAHQLIDGAPSPLDEDRPVSSKKGVTDVFGWKGQLAVIDKFFDDGTQGETSTRTSLSQPRLPGNMSTSPISPDHDSSSMHEDSFFSSAGLANSSQTEEQSPAIVKLNQSMKATSIKVSELLGSQTSSSSPAYGSQIADSPKARALSTPLTSDDENEQSSSNDQAPVLSVKKGKKKGSSRIKSKGSLQKTVDDTLDEGKISKIKKLSKKEEKESKKAHARLMADQKVIVSKRTEQFSISQFLGRIEKRANGISSDPIQDFTSSPMDKHAELNGPEEAQGGPSRFQDGSDEELPDMAVVMKVQQEEKRKVEISEQRKNELAVMKERALKYKSGNIDDDTESDDLEFVEGTLVPEDNPKPRTISNYEKKLSGIAGFSVGRNKPQYQALDNSQGDRYLKRAAKPTFGTERNRQASANVDHRALKAAILAKASKQSLKVTKEKEEEWLRSGGKLVKREGIVSGGPLSIANIAKTLADRRMESAAHEAEASGSDSDSEYNEDEASEEYDSEGAPQEKYSGESDNDVDADGAKTGDIEMPEMSQARTETDNDDLPLKAHKAKQAKRALVSDSDEEDSVPKGKVLVPETSMIMDDSDQHENRSLNGIGSDEENKENDNRYMFHGGEDKENLVISPSSPTSPLRQRITKIGNRTISPLSISPQQRVVQKREPLQARFIDDFDQPTSRSPEASSTKADLKNPTGSFTPALLSNKGGFSQLFEDDDLAPSRSDAPSKGVLQPAFFLQQSPKARSSAASEGFLKPGESSKSISPRSQKYGFADHMKGLDKEFSLTLDIKLVPALDINTQDRQKADSIFEKEQQFVLEEASDVKSSGKQELYITDTGLLTQTRPDGATPAGFRILQQHQQQSGSPMLASHVSSARAIGQRQPLSTLSLESPASSPRLNRLVKGKGRARTPDVAEPALLPGLALSSNAFDKLRKGAEKQQQRERRKLEKSEYVEGEAQESDEDEMFGFGMASKDDDNESDEEDPNAVVEGLVDDAHLNAEQLAEDKVLEKVKELAEADDEVLQKYHQAAIEGKYRSKRRGGGFAMEDSETDEDEDDEARRARRRMHKKRKIEGDTLEALGKDEKSRAFYDAYQRDVQEDDNDDFAHLNNDDMEEDEGGDENEPPEVVATSEIQARLREVAREQKGKEREAVFDPDNIDWAEPISLSDEEVDVKEVENRSRRILSSRRPAFGQADNSQYDDLLPKHSDSWNETQLANWRKEQSGRNLGTGGTRGAITVTGHGKKGGSGLTRLGSASNAREPSGKRSLAKAASILAKVSDRQGRFD